MSYVRLNHGRWLADCPTGCGGAEKLHPDGNIRVHSDVSYGLTREGVFVCGSCGVESSVSWPSRDQLEEIEAVVQVRPMINRNWTPGETIDALVSENIEHGLAVA